MKTLDFTKLAYSKRELEQIKEVSEFKDMSENEIKFTTCRNLLLQACQLVSKQGATLDDQLKFNKVMRKFEDYSDSLELDDDNFKFLYYNFTTAMMPINVLIAPISEWLDEIKITKDTKDKKE